MGSVRANQHGKLFMEFRYRGLRCREGTRLNDTPRNRKAVKKRLGIIEGEIALGTFDYAQHFPDGNMTPVFGGGPKPKRRLRYAEYTEEWWETHSRSIKLSTLKEYRSSLTCHLIPFFGEMFLDEIRPAAIKQFLASMTVSDKRKRNIMVPFKIQMREALENQIIDVDPTQFIRLPRGRREEIDPLSFDEVHEFLTKVDPEYRNYFEVAFYTGMRPNEQIALKWGAIDFRNKKIRISEGRVLGEESAPKTLSSIRDIDMLPPVIDALKRQKPRSMLRGDYVFCNTTGGPLDVHNLRNRVWYRALTRAGMRQRTMYQTRHTFATLMLSSGENPNWVAAMMGHSTPSTLFRHYNRYIPNLTRRDGSAFMAFIERRLS